MHGLQSLLQILFGQNVKCYLGRRSVLQVLWLCFHLLEKAIAELL